MSVAWEEETGVKLTLMPFSHALRRIGYTRKKRAFSTLNETKPVGTRSLPHLDGGGLVLWSSAVVKCFHL